jgi:hypothetical protein
MNDEVYKLYGELKLIAEVNPFWSSCLEKFLQPDCQGILNAHRATKRVGLLKKLAQQGHKVKKQNVPAQCKKTNFLLCNGV